WKQDHNGEDYTVKYAKPIDALMARRPDLGNLPLTCENTNTALPYIDIVNEILEYFLVNKKLTDEVAHDTGSATTPELLAEPQNIEPKAYEILKTAVYPLTLPFDLWIETVREFCMQYDTPLWKLVAALQPLAGADFATNKKIAAEALGLAPAEYALLTDEAAIDKLPALYGFANDAETSASLRIAKQLADKLGITYKELVELVQTRFINPELDDLVLLKKLSITASDVFRFKKANGFKALTADEQAAFEKKVSDATALYGIDIKAAIETAWTNNVFSRILLLNDTVSACNFETTVVSYADKEALKFDWLKFNLFIRLWKKLGWPMNEVDRLMNVFMPAAMSIVFNDPSKPEADRAKALASG
ncbi:MAG TPA: hypothetical protein VEB42_10930, partial [Chitinophagaceae bacterium]|nr:hypothetical protein [Chitinophagaceae bacterium]